jgi:hypothetical protein
MFLASGLMGDLTREIFGRQRDFRDGGDGEADWPAGPRRAGDPRCGGRQRRWGGTRWVMARVRAVPAGFAARAPREKNRPGFRKGVNELSGKVSKTHVIY